MRCCFRVLAVSFLLLALLAPAFCQADAQQTMRAQAGKLMGKGNWNDAYVLYQKLVLDPADDPQQAGNDFASAVQCLGRLNREAEFDAFADKAVAMHGENWQLLSVVASEYLNASHYGYIIAGQFVRGDHRGGGRAVGTGERDRTRALQLYTQAVMKSGHAAEDEKAQLYWSLAEAVGKDRTEPYRYSQSWRLQYLTDLSKLPDYGPPEYYYYGDNPTGAPVDADGNPVYYALPASWADARNDGERWRWAMMQAAEHDQEYLPRAQMEFANFLYRQFGVQTMSEYGWFHRQDDDVTKPGPYALQTLHDNETIARLATGVKRFTLPDEYNCIKLYLRVANGKSGDRDRANEMLGSIFADRRQYDKALIYYKRAKDQEQIKQIAYNWGRFESVGTQPAGKGATVDFRFRNGQAVHLTARAIDTEKLLADVEHYIRSKPKNIPWETVNIADLGRRLVEQNQRKYLGATVADWTQKLQPRPGHFERRVTLNTPLKSAGAYLLTAQMAGGNTSNIVLWVADLAIVKKPLAKRMLYYVADAITGAPVAGAKLRLFGYREQWIDRRKDKHGAGYYTFPTTTRATVTDTLGKAYVPADADNQQYQWLVTARAGDRRAYLGFTYGGSNDYYDYQYHETKTFIITDRPVYRPGQPVKFKVWMSVAQYDREGNSPFAGQRLNLTIRDPRNEKVYNGGFTADGYGGFDGEFMLPKNAMLGEYQVQTENGYGSFRVEEYKKPEYEVTVEAPKEPVMLGETITATIKANYYFGAPVTNAKVKYKILRSSYSANWYPLGRWDWFYGPGYWWFAYDCPWFSGWHDWGCPRPYFAWWGRYGQAQPELVAQAEAPIGKDGTLKVTIDTAVAKAMLSDTDHRYEITAEVTDQSRRTIVGQGEVLVARKPFTVYAWVDRGHYRAGDVIHASFCAQTLDHQPVRGRGRLLLLKINYLRQNGELKPVEHEVGNWELDTDAQGQAALQIKAAQAGQYRLSYSVTDAADHSVQGGYLFTVRGTGYDGSGYRFNDVELIPDKREYAPGDTVHLLVNTARANATVLLFVRPSNGVYLPPQILHLNGKSTVVDIPVAKKDMPNFFVEAVTLADGKIFTEAREIVVPPEKRVLNVDVLPAKKQFKPGEKATVKLRLTDANGKPFHGTTVVSLYDKAVEYISGGSNVPEIKEFFWKWRRDHYPQTESSLQKVGGNVIKPNTVGMESLGAFGYTVADEEVEQRHGTGVIARLLDARVVYAYDAISSQHAPMAITAAMPAAPVASFKALGHIEGADNFAMSMDANNAQGRLNQQLGQPLVQPTIRSNFADTALWVAKLDTNAQGEAETTLTMPENLTTWKARVWAMGDGARVGEGTTELTTTKDLIVRLQAPRFFTQKDEVVISANVHNYLKTKKTVQVSLDLEGGTLAALTSIQITTTGLGGEEGPRDQWIPLVKPDVKTIEIAPDGETRVDWRVRAKQPGTATIRVKALTDEESDAMEMTFPVYVHGMLKTESFSGALRPEQTSGEVKFRVPAERRQEQSRLEVRYSPTLAGAMVDALPYLVDYPYGCTEQTLNRFLPTVITQRVLQRMGLNLKQIEAKRANLNAQEIGDDKTRANDWQRMYLPEEQHNPVFDEKAVKDMVQAEQERLASMQCEDGGWGWFSGEGEQSWPHTTALVVHGLQVAHANNALAIPDSLARGLHWLALYQNEQVRLLQLWVNTGGVKGKWKADALDAFVYMVLADEGKKDDAMRDFLYRDRTDLPVYAKAMFGLALHKQGDVPRRDMLMRNIEQFLVQDDENQTAYLKVDDGWWCWYGSEIEADAYYLKLLAAVEPKSERTSRLVKYLINNRKHATYWNSTRDTAIAIEAFADFLKASGETNPNLTVQLLLDGKPVKAVTITKDNLFTFDNKFVLEGDAVTTGEHTLTVQKQGTGPLYYNAYLTNFTLEDQISKAGLEIKVERAFYKLVPKAQTVKTAGDRGQVLDQAVEAYDRIPLANLAAVKSGDLIEVELKIDSKNDYEYLVFEDMKAAGCEPVEVQSGYNDNDMGAYMELRDDRVTFFVRALARGTHSLSYRLRAETPGQFSALPTKAGAMYAPELKANSDEMKLRIEDQ